MSMFRRRYLAALSAGLAGFGGCAQLPTAGNTPPSRTISEQPCPPDADSSLADHLVVCSHTADRSSALAYLLPEPRSTTVADGRPVEEVHLTLHNRTEVQTLRFNPASWTLRKATRDGWEEIPAEQGGVGVVEVPPGATHRWTLLEAAGLILHDPTFEPGLYAAEISVGQVYDPDSAERLNTTAIALIRLDPQ